MLYRESEGVLSGMSRCFRRGPREIQEVFGGLLRISRRFQGIPEALQGCFWGFRRVSDATFYPLDINHSFLHMFDIRLCFIP